MAKKKKEQLLKLLTLFSDISRVTKSDEELRRVSRIFFANFGCILVSEKHTDSNNLANETF